MNSIETIIQNRRSTRSYDPNFEIDSITTNNLIKLGQMAPSSFNIQHCKFVVIHDQKLRQKIREVAMDQKQVTDASLFIVVCAKLDAWKESISHKWAHVDDHVQGFVRKSIDEFYQKDGERQRDEAIRSCGMASQNLLLAAEGMGFQSGAMVGFDFEKVAKLIQLPINHIISNFVVIGKGNEINSLKSSRLPTADVLINNTFQL